MTLEFRLATGAADAVDTPCAVVGVFQGGPLPPAAAAIDAASGGVLKRLADSGDLRGKARSSLWLYHLAGVKAERVLVVGLGDQANFGAAQFSLAAQTAAQQLARAPLAAATTWLGELDVAGRDAPWRARVLALAFDHAAYRFKLVGKGKQSSTPKLARLDIVADAAAQAGLDQAAGIAKGVEFARELGNLPPNICTPAYLAERARQLAEAHEGVTLDVLEPEKMRELGMGALLAVGSGSMHPPRLIVLRWQGGGDAKPHALVGKGVTFDSGGINIKPSPGMEEMKFDMCGGAGVLGTFLAAVELKLPLNLVCVVPSAENMPGGESYRPSDVLTTLSGLTVEVLNTDAEGRLILCDALSYVQRFEPQTIIDVATLTGACVVALGKHASGLMSADDELAGQLLAAGEDAMDRAWRLPLWDDYQSALESGNADVANIGGKYGGAITAGCFLSRFTEGYRWAHLDIAGTAWGEGRKALATGRPVGLLTQYLIGKAGAGDQGPGTGNK
ncbi:MAG TPA: leucyl aminopeptidase [Rhodanobacteraceae bacterium]|nr:leucyl aminopeptidase [Rhodanobacteraceae bacterium]